MSWTQDQLQGHPKRDDLLAVNTKSLVQATEKAGLSENKAEDIKAQATPGQISFTVVGDPMGKPRMTQRDRWAKRPAVLRYRDYCDRIKEAVPTLILTADVYAIEITAYIAMPASWSKKKKASTVDTMCRSKPDWDNIGKAVCDALFEEDSIIASGSTRKFWCLEGSQRTEVKVLFNAPKT